jgi:hypothetical protein
VRDPKTPKAERRRTGVAAWLASLLRALLALTRKERLRPPSQAEARSAPPVLTEALPSDHPERAGPAALVGAQLETPPTLASPDAEAIPPAPESAAEQTRPITARQDGEGTAGDREDAADLAAQRPERPTIENAGAPLASAAAPVREVRRPPGEPDREEHGEPAVPEQPASNNDSAIAAAGTFDPAMAEDAPLTSAAAPLSEADPAPDEPDREEHGEPGVPEQPAIDASPIAAAESSDPVMAEADSPVDAETASDGVEPPAANLGIAPAPAEEPPLPNLQRVPSQYRPKLREQPREAAARAPDAAPRPSGPRPAPAPGSLEADLLLAFQPGGWGIAISLLLRRPDGSPEQITVRLAGAALDLSVIDDGLFEPIPVGDADAALRQGVIVESVGGGPRRWVRTGRRLHVFTERPGVFGFTSVPRVMIGQENIIVCDAALADRVLDLCHLTGSDAPQDVAGPGVPPGWRCFRGYRPRRPGAWDDDDIFLALSPLPDAAIELTGGVAISRSAWISARGPAIRILGCEPGAGDVTIDLQPATQAETGQWVAPGWETLGNHAVRYAGLLRRYEIVEVEDGWAWWPAHTGPGLALAGALAGSESGRRPAVVLQDREAWLLGARPGEAVRAVALPGAPGASAAPSFAPVWAIPPKARRRPAPRLLDSPNPPQAPAAGTPLEAIRLWRQIVRDAASAPAGGGATATELWRQYQAAARMLKRRA